MSEGRPSCFRNREERADRASVSRQLKNNPRVESGDKEAWTNDVYGSSSIVSEMGSLYVWTNPPAWISSSDPSSLSSPSATAPNHHQVQRTGSVSVLEEGKIGW